MHSLSSISYNLQEITRLQYANRFPIHPQVPFSKTIFHTTILELILLVVLSCQCLKYRKSKHCYQSISTALMFILCSFTGITLIILYCGLMNVPRIGRYGLFYIDLIDWFWLCGSLAGSFKYCPQVSKAISFLLLASALLTQLFEIALNWIGLNVKGIANLSLHIDCLTVFILALTKALQSKEKFYLEPVVSILMIIRYIVGLTKRNRMRSLSSCIS